MVETTTDPSIALRDADIVCTATTARAPVFDDADLRPGTHINAVGAFTPEMQEIPPATVIRSRIVIDNLDAILTEAGDLLKPLNDGPDRPVKIRNRARSGRQRAAQSVVPTIRRSPSSSQSEMRCRMSWLLATRSIRQHCAASEPRSISWRRRLLLRMRWIKPVQGRTRYRISREASLRKTKSVQHSLRMLDRCAFEDQSAAMAWIVASAETGQTPHGHTPSMCA